MADLRYAYCSNGLRDHDLGGALALVAANGYAGIALTLDHGHFDPFADDLPGRLRRLRQRLDDLGLSVVVETGARFLLDARRKHEPTLVSTEGRDRRLDLLRRAVHIADALDAGAVHVWSGRLPDGVPAATGWERLVDGCAQILGEADGVGVRLAFEPEPGMLVERIDDWRRLAAALGDHPRFGITLDLGHCLCVEDGTVAECVAAVADRLFHVQVEDMRRGVHEHLMFGDGDLDLPAALGALGDVRYRGLVAVELSRHSHTAHTTVPDSIARLRRAEQAAAREPAA